MICDRNLILYDLKEINYLSNADLIHAFCSEKARELKSLTKLDIYACYEERFCLEPSAWQQKDSKNGGCLIDLDFCCKMQLAKHTLSAFPNARFCIYDQEFLQFHRKIDSLTITGDNVMTEVRSTKEKSRRILFSKRPIERIHEYFINFSHFTQISRVTFLCRIAPFKSEKKLLNMQK